MSSKKKKKIAAKKESKKTIKKAEKKTEKKAAKKTVLKAAKKVVKKILKKVSKKANKKVAKKVLSAKPKKASAVKKVPATKKVSKTKAVKAAATKNKSLPKVSKAKNTPPNAQLEHFLSPLNDRLLILRDEPATMTAGGLFLPEMSLTEPNKGKVIAVGRGIVTKKGDVKALDVKVGDRVVFQNFSGSKVEKDGQTLLLLRESEIIGVIE